MHPERLVCSPGCLGFAHDERRVVSHTILTLDGVAVFDAVADKIGELRNGLSSAWW